MDAGPPNTYVCGKKVSPETAECYERMKGRWSGTITVNEDVASMCNRPSQKEVHQVSFNVGCDALNGAAVFVPYLGDLKMDVNWCELRSDYTVPTGCGEVSLSDRFRPSMGDCIGTKGLCGLDCVDPTYLTCQLKRSN